MKCDVVLRFDAVNNVYEIIMDDKVITTIYTLKQAIEVFALYVDDNLKQ